MAGRPSWGELKGRYRISSIKRTNHYIEQEIKKIAIQELRLNERIRVSEVRLIGVEGNQLGIVPTKEALEQAKELGLDLIEVAPEAKPPVAKIANYSKMKYEAEIKEKEARKHNKSAVLKEIKLRLKIEKHDFQTKIDHICKFLEHGDKVKVTIMFKGREISHPALGVKLMDELIQATATHGTPEGTQKREGRDISLILLPISTAKK